MWYVFSHEKVDNCKDYLELNYECGVNVLCENMPNNLKAAFVNSSKRRHINVLSNSTQESQFQNVIDWWCFCTWGSQNFYDHMILDDNEFLNEEINDGITNEENFSDDNCVIFEAPVKEDE